jgi:DNA-binding response OmpR family regulator
MMIPVLLIDDDRELGMLLQEYLQEEFHLQSACDGVSGLDEALHHSYAVVILDLMLPGMNGLEVLKLLRRQSRLPVLVLSACGNDKHSITALELGADDYLSKPFQPQELLTRLRALSAS